MKYLKLFENYIKHDNHLVYHGTNKKFTKFDFNKIGKGYGMSEWGYGIYFTEDREYATKYSKWVVEKHGGKPYVYCLNIKNLNFYEIDYYDNIKLPENEREHILSKLREVGKPEIIKRVRTFHPDYNWKDDSDNRYEDFIYDGTNGDLILDKWIERYRFNFTHKIHSYSANTFYREILPDYFNSVEKNNGYKLTSEFLSYCGYDGVSFIDDVDTRGFVIFNSKVLDDVINLK